MIALKVENLQKVYKIRLDVRSSDRRLSEAMASLFQSKKQQGPSSYDFYALKDVSFEVQEGDRVGLIGKNGAGKSTLLKLISRVTYPSHGKIGINGRVSSLLEVGTGFHPELSGRENIYLNGAVLGMKRSEIRRKFDEIVEFSGTEQFLDTPIKRYSSGMYVRLAFSVAAFLDSEILILDEVLAVGDAAFQKKCLDKMDEISRGGRTILFVGHNLSVLETLCNRGIYLSEGKLVYDGPSAEAIRQYVNDVSDLSLEFGKSRDLSQQDRPGTGAIRFQNFRVDSHPKEVTDTDTLRVGDDVSVYIQAKAFEAVKDLNICLIVYDIYGTRLIDANLAIHGDSVSFQKNEIKTIHFRLKDVLLKPGEYILGLWAGLPNIDVDYLHDAARIRIEAPLNSKQYSIIFPGFYQCRFEHEIHSGSGF